MNAERPDLLAADSALVLARVDSGLFWRRGDHYRAEVRDWLTANGIDYNHVLCSRDVEVVLLDAPAIVRLERVEEGPRAAPMVSFGPAPGEVVHLGSDGVRRSERVVHSLLRVPLPDHLSDPVGEVRGG